METGIQELPLTPAMLRVVHRESRRRQRTLLIIGGGLTAFFLLLGLALGALTLMAVVAAGIAVIMVGVAWSAGRKARRAASQGVLWRMVGPIAITTRTVAAGEDESSAAPLYRIRIGDRSVSIPADLARKLEGVPAGTVDCIGELDLILEVRDPSGQLVYRDRRYQD